MRAGRELWWPTGLLIHHVQRVLIKLELTLNCFPTAEFLGGGLSKLDNFVLQDSSEDTKILNLGTNNDLSSSRALLGYQARIRRGGGGRTPTPFLRQFL